MATPAGPEHRQLLWVDNSQVLGVARTVDEALELFIVGPAITPASVLVGHHLSHDSWTRTGGAPLLASRLLLVGAAHFDSVAAFLCAELVANGVLTEPAKAFRRTEPVIELALQRLALSDDFAVGLLGELVLLRSLCARVPAAHFNEVLRGWKGHERSARDIQLGSLGIEVKTTRLPMSHHRVQGIRQVEQGHIPGGGLESSFFLVSIGLGDPPSGGGGHSVPGVIDDIVTTIRARAVGTTDDLVDAFLSRVNAYGGGAYDHSEPSHRALAGRVWGVSFVRAYDVLDPLVSVLRSVDAAKFGMLDPATIEFVLTLPTKVNGDLNPIVGLTAVTDAMLAGAWPA